MQNLYDMRTRYLPPSTLQTLYDAYMYQLERAGKPIPADPMAEVVQWVEMVSSERLNGAFYAQKSAQNGLVRPSERTNSDLERVAAYKQAHPQASVSKISGATGVKRTKVWTLLKQIEARGS